MVAGLLVPVSSLRSSGTFLEEMVAPLGGGAPGSLSSPSCRGSESALLMELVGGASGSLSSPSCRGSESALLMELETAAAAKSDCGAVVSLSPPSCRVEEVILEVRGGPGAISQKVSLSPLSMP